jgi:hypothetical protein
VAPCPSSGFADACNSERAPAPDQRQGVSTNKLLGMLLVGVWMVALSVRPHSATFNCPAFSSPKIEISIEPPDDRTDTTKTLATMRAAAQNRHPAPIVGAYMGALQYGIQIDDTVRETKISRFCATPQYVTLNFKFERIIYIPREFVDDPCLVTLAHDHEAKHAESDVTALGTARPTFEGAVRMAVRRATREAASARSDAIARLTAAIQSSVNDALDEMTAAREKLDAEIDGSAELDRLKTACGGRAAQPVKDGTISQ